MAFAGFEDRVLILASGSSTRKVMLEDADIDFVVQAPSVDEQAIKHSALADGIHPTDIAVMLAEVKAHTIAQRHGNGYFVLGSDQILVCDGKVMSKPRNREEAIAQLSFLSGKTHDLITTAVIFRDGERIWHTIETPKLTMRKFDTSYISSYLDHIGDAAFWSPGSYQIEALGAHLFTQISGSYYAVLGLPLLPLLGFLREHRLSPDTAIKNGGGQS